MNELLLRAPCFGGRGFESSQDLTLPERLWWTRASSAKTSKNVQEALKLVQESRNGRYIRGFVLDSELALLDEDISRMMDVHLGFDAPAFSSANCKIVLDSVEREKVKSQILMERLLLRSCEGVKPSFNDLLKGSSMEQQIGTHGYSTKTPLTTETSLEAKVTQKGSDFREDDNIGDIVLQFSMEPKMSTSNITIGSTDSVLSKISLEAKVTQKGRDFREDDNIGDAVLQFSMEPKMSTSNLTIGSTDSVLSKIRLEAKVTQKGSDFREDDNIGDAVLQFSMEPKMSTSNLTIGSTDSVLSKISVDTHIAPKQKRGFGKRLQSFFSKLGRCIGSGMCCGRRVED